MRVSEVRGGWAATDDPVPGEPVWPTLGAAVEALSGRRPRRGGLDRRCWRSSPPRSAGAPAAPLPPEEGERLAALPRRCPGAYVDGPRVHDSGGWYCFVGGLPDGAWAMEFGDTPARRRPRRAGAGRRPAGPALGGRPAPLRHRDRARSRGRRRSRRARSAGTPPSSADSPGASSRTWSLRSSFARRRAVSSRSVRGPAARAAPRSTAATASRRASGPALGAEVLGQVGGRGVEAAARVGRHPQAHRAGTDAGGDADGHPNGAGRRLPGLQHQPQRGPRPGPHPPRARCGRR